MKTKQMTKRQALREILDFVREDYEFEYMTDNQEQAFRMLEWHIISCDDQLRVS
jgi:hypothetical protein